MASIERHGAGFRVIWRDGGKGSTPKKSKVFGTKGEAKAEKRAVEARLAARTAIAQASAIPLAELIERYLADVAARGRGAHNYAEDCRASMTKLAKARGWETAQDVTMGNVGVLKTSQHRYLKSVLRYASRIDQPLDHRLLTLRAPARKRKPVADLITPWQRLALFARARRFGADLVLAAHLVATYGHRPESLAKTKVGDVEMPDPARGGWIRLEVKSGDTIRHPILPRTARMIARVTAGRTVDAPLILRPAEAACSHKRHSDFSGEGWPCGNDLSIYWYHQVGERVTPATPGIYHLKRLAISSLLSAGLDVATIASITGHRTPAVILTYARTNESRQRAALRAMESLSGFGSAPQVHPSIDVSR